MLEAENQLKIPQEIRDIIQIALLSSTIFFLGVYH